VPFRTRRFTPFKMDFFPIVLWRLDIWIAIFIFALGSVVGSFLNACIYRLPRGLSIVYPPSFCPSCGHVLRWYDLIPILSYLLLGGKCRYCGSRIHLRYLAVELLTGFLFLLSYHTFSLTINFIFSCVFFSILEFIAFVDFETMEVMDLAIYLGAVLGILFNLKNFGFQGALFSIKGAIYGAGIISLIFYVSNGGMGEGDIGIAALLGFWLGWKSVILSIAIAFLAGGLVAGVLLLLKLKRFGEKVPFGPFLALGGGIAFLKGSFLIELYWRSLG